MKTKVRLAGGKYLPEHDIIWVGQCDLVPGTCVGMKVTTFIKPDMTKPLPEDPPTKGFYISEVHLDLTAEDPYQIIFVKP